MRICIDISDDDLDGILRCCLDKETYDKLGGNDINEIAIMLADAILIRYYHPEYFDRGDVKEIVQEVFDEKFID